MFSVGKRLAKILTLHSCVVCGHLQRSPHQPVSCSPSNPGGGKHAHTAQKDALMIEASKLNIKCVFSDRCRGHCMHSSSFFPEAIMAILSKFTHQRYTILIASYGTRFYHTLNTLISFMIQQISIIILYA